MMLKWKNFWVYAVAVLLMATQGYAGTWVEKDVFVDQNEGVYGEVLPAENMDPSHAITWGPQGEVLFFFSGQPTPQPGDVGCWLYGHPGHVVWWQGVFNRQSTQVIIQFRSCDDNDGWADIYVDNVLEYSVNTLNRGDFQLVGSGFPNTPHTVKIQTRTTGPPDDVSFDYVAAPRPVPSLTGWGLFVLLVLLLASGIYVVYRRRRGIVAS